MQIHDAIRALRNDPVPQHRAQERVEQAVAGWRGKPLVAAALADLAAFAGGSPLAECDALSQLFDEECGAATDLAGTFVAEMVHALADAPLGQLPGRFFTDGLSSVLMLARSGNVTLSLAAIDGDRLAAVPAPAAVRFSPGEAWEHFLSGSAQARLVECRTVDGVKADLRVRDIAIGAGTIICRDAERQALQVLRVNGCLVSLRLQRRARKAGVAREFALTDGRLERQIAGNPRDSRLELMMSLLGRMGRTDAAPALARIARADGAESLRWQALRECLALDTETGFAALAHIAESQADPLSVPAASLHARLVAMHPELAKVVPCPA